jgi:hypothetical protein
MTMFNFTCFLAAAATAVAFSLTASSGALAHGAGMSGSHGNIASTNVTGNTTNKLTRLGDHDVRRLRFSRFGYVYSPSACIYKWTELGRVRICPDYDY